MLCNIINGCCLQIAVYQLYSFANFSQVFDRSFYDLFKSRNFFYKYLLIFFVKVCSEAKCFFHKSRIFQNENLLKCSFILTCFSYLHDPRFSFWFHAHVLLEIFSKTDLKSLLKLDQIFPSACCEFSFRAKQNACLRGLKKGGLTVKEAGRNTGLVFVKVGY